MSDNEPSTENAPSGISRRQMLRRGTLVGATALWIAPSASVYAMTESMAQATSGTTSPTQPEATNPTEPETANPTRPETTNPTEPETTATTGPTDVQTGDRVAEVEQPVEVAGQEVSVTTTSNPDVSVLDNEITAEAPASVQSVKPPVVAQTQLPQTGADIDVLTGIGATLTGLGAAALAATREPDAD